MKKVVIGILAVAVVVFVMLNLFQHPWTLKQVQGDGAGVEKPVVKIGVIGPMTGDAALMGQNCRQALDFALENIKDSKVDYKLIVEDDVWQAAKAVMAANKLVNADKVDVLFTCSAPTGSSVVTISKDKKKFMMATIASPKEIAEGSPYSFLHWTPPLKEAEKVLEIVEKNGAKKIVIFEQNHVFPVAVGNALREVMAKNGIEVVTYSYVGNERNFNDIIEKARRDNADMFVMMTLPPSINVFVKTLKEKGIDTPYTSVEIPLFVEDKSIFEGVEFVDVYDGNPEIMNAYMKKYDTQNTYGVAFVYDGMMIINKIVNDFYAKNEKIPNAEEMAEAMMNLKNWNGTVGKVSVNQNRVLDSEPVFKKVVDGKIVVIE